MTRAPLTVGLLDFNDHDNDVEDDDPRDLVPATQAQPKCQGATAARRVGPKASGTAPKPSHNRSRSPVREKGGTAAKAAVKDKKARERTTSQGLLEEAKNMTQKSSEELKGLKEAEVKQLFSRLEKANTRLSQVRWDETLPADVDLIEELTQAQHKLSLLQVIMQTWTKKRPKRRTGDASATATMPWQMREHLYEALAVGLAVPLESFIAAYDDHIKYALRLCLDAWGSSPPEEATWDDLIHSLQCVVSCDSKGDAKTGVTSRTCRSTRRCAITRNLVCSHTALCT